MIIYKLTRYSLVPGVLLAGWVFASSISNGAGAAGALTQVFPPTVVSVATSSITLTAIPATPFNDLVLSIQGRGDNAAQRITVLLQFNGDVAANYDWQTLDIHNATAAPTQVNASTSIGIGVLPGASNSPNYAGQVVIEIVNYRRTAFNKSIQSEGGLRYDNTPNQGYQTFSGQWNSTAAITQIVLLASAGNFIPGTIVTLWGRN